MTKGKKNYLKDMITKRLYFLISIFLFLECGSQDTIVKEPETTIDSQIGINLSLRTLKLIDSKKKEFQWRAELKESEFKEINDLENSSEVIEKILKSQEPNLTPSYKNYLLVQKLAGIEFTNRKFGEASKIWDKYGKYFPSKEKEIKEVQKILSESEGSIFVTDLGREVNVGNASLPVIESNGSKLYFTGVGFPDSKGGQDIYEVSLDDSNWTSRKALNLINSSGNESASSISIDGTELLITGNYSSSYGNSDIFASFLTDKGWTNVRHYRQPINTEHYEADGFKTPDGRAIMYVSDRPEGIFDYHKKGEYYAGSYEGNTDIYISFRQDSGSYGNPINLGPIINSPGSERAPFLHADGKTLYFSTDGNGGFGELELYKSVRLDDTWTNWSVPIHLGKFVNSPLSDLGFQITALADKGFLTLETANNSSKLVMISPLPKRVIPEETINILKGVVFDEYDTPIQTEIEWIDLIDPEIIGKISSKPITGEYYFSIPLGKDYIVYPKKKNYIITSVIPSFKKDKNSIEKTIDFKMVSIPFAISSGSEYILNSILFVNETDEISQKSYYELDRLAQLLLENPDIKIDIICHYSSVKQESFNLDLSNKRIVKIVNYLISKNVNSSRIKGKGIGSSKPIVPNISEENRIKNRRIGYTISSVE
jgi:outer membrane protein OmpA-like peptidoglycan-associated protein